MSEVDYWRSEAERLKRMVLAQKVILDQIVGALPESPAIPFNGDHGAYVTQILRCVSEGEQVTLPRVSC